MRVLGVDPGTVATGWGVLDVRGRQLLHVASGVIRSRGPLPIRLASIYEAICQIVGEFRPTSVGIEKTFVGDNVQSAFRLGEARGAILVAAGQAHIPAWEYSPSEVKLAVTGSGRAAKAQMQAMVARVLGLDGAMATDQADALGVAICHVHVRQFAQGIDGSVSVGSRRPAADRRAWGRRVAELASEEAAASAPRRGAPRP